MLVAARLGRRLGAAGGGGGGVAMLKSRGPTMDSAAWGIPLWSRRAIDVLAKLAAVMAY